MGHFMHNGHSWSSQRSSRWSWTQRWSLDECGALVHAGGLGALLWMIWPCRLHPLALMRFASPFSLLTSTPSISVSLFLHSLQTNVSSRTQNKWKSRKRRDRLFILSQASRAQRRRKSGRNKKRDTKIFWEKVWEDSSSRNVKKEITELRDCVKG